MNAGDDGEAIGALVTEPGSTAEIRYAHVVDNEPSEFTIEDDIDGEVMAVEWTVVADSFKERRVGNLYSFGR